MKQEYLYWALNTTAGVSSEHLDYTRNQATQNKSRTICSLYPSFTFKILPTKKAGEQLEFQLMYEQSASSIFDMLDYTDDAVPQIVKLGNPNLKGYASSTFNVNITGHQDHVVCGCQHLQPPRLWEQDAQYRRLRDERFRQPAFPQGQADSQRGGQGLLPCWGKV